LDFSVINLLKKNGSASGQIMFDGRAEGQVWFKGEGTFFVTNLKTLLRRQESAPGNPGIFGFGAAMARLGLDFVAQRAGDRFIF
jgi:hypothetical protein